MNRFSSQKKAIHILHAGAHRGGTEFQRQLVSDPLRGQVRHVEVIDPTEGRALERARAYEASGVPAVARPARVEDILAERAGDPDAVAVLTVDDIGTVGTVMAVSRRPTISQILGRGPSVEGVPGPAFALASTGFPVRRDDRMRSASFYKKVASLVPAQHSVAISEDPLNAQRAQILRRTTTARSIAILDDLERVQDMLTLDAFLWKKVTWPMTIVEGSGGPVESYEQAQDEAAGVRAACVAVCSTSRVDFYVFEQMGGRPVLRLHVPLVARQVVPPKVQVVQESTPLALPSPVFAAPVRSIEAPRPANGSSVSFDAAFTD